MTLFYNKMGQNGDIVPTCSFGKSNRKVDRVLRNYIHLLATSSNEYQFIASNPGFPKLRNKIGKESLGSSEENFTVNTDGCGYVVPVMCHPAFVPYSLGPRLYRTWQFMTVLAHL